MAAKSKATRLTPRHPVDLPAWQSLATHYRRDIRLKTLADLFARDRKRAKNFTLASGDLVLDYSKNLLNATIRKLLFKLAREAKVSAAIKAMFAGEVINVTENRPALHVALRAKISDRVAHERRDIAEVWRVLHQVEQFVNGVHEGSLRGHTGVCFTDIVNIGIGGSDLGNSMIAKALRQYWRAGMRYHGVSNIDGTQLADLKYELDPKRTLIVVCSKTFTTLETMTNANAARAWIIEALGHEALTKHFAAASTNHEAMDAFGINPAYRFGFWDWVGGRYSLWSAVGLSLALVIGTEHFQALLNGARRMDLHFRQAPLTENMPVLLALIAIWNNNFLGAESQAILPYNNRLERFPAFLQQLQMESNGKSVRRDGRPVKCKTGMVIWGEAGSNAQHSFYQLLHQGTRLIPADFILPLQSSGSTQAQQDLAIANCLAQSEALMDGYSKKQAIADLRAAGLSAMEAKELAPHKVHPGNRPSNTILLPALTPDTLGQLIALYEHKVFVEGHIWGINSFDQWGVELGKKLATELSDAVTDPARHEGKNSSTRSLLERVSSLRS